jgi:hypothetical protein
MKIQPIGSISHGIDGSDFYSRVKVEEADLPDIPADSSMEDWLHKKFVAEHCYDSPQPGQLFCDRVTVVTLPYHDDEFIAIVHIRRDC